MPVVINDFEVVSDAAQGERGTASAGSGQSETQGASSAPTPNDIRRILRRQLERIERVRAD
jgi:hypothetical protein